MRKLTASILATAALAGVAFGGTALAASSPTHPSERAASVDRSSSKQRDSSKDRSRHESSSRDRASTARDRSEANGR